MIPFKPKLPCIFEKGMRWRLKRLFVKTVRRWKIPADHLEGVIVTDRRPVNYRTSEVDGTEVFVERGTKEDSAAVFDFETGTMKEPTIHLSLSIRNDPEAIIHEIGHYRTMAFIDREPKDPLFKRIVKVQDSWRDGKVMLGEMGITAESVDGLPSEFLADCYMAAYCGTKDQWRKLSSWCLSNGLELVSVLRLPETFISPGPNGSPGKTPVLLKGSVPPGAPSGRGNKERS